MDFNEGFASRLELLSKLSVPYALMLLLFLIAMFIADGLNWRRASGRVKLRGWSEKIVHNSLKTPKSVNINL